MKKKQHKRKEPLKDSSPECFIAVHIGAGHHSPKTEPQYKAGVTKPYLVVYVPRIHLVDSPCFQMGAPTPGTRTHLLTCPLHTVMKDACLAAQATFRGGGTALDAVVAAIAVLEVSPAPVRPE